MWMYWPDTGVWWWSQAFASLLDLDGTPDWQAFEALLVPADRGVLERMQATLAAGARQHEEVLEFLRPIGGWRWLLLKSFRNAQGVYSGTLQDISDRQWMLHKFGDPHQAQRLQLFQDRLNQLSFELEPGDKRLLPRSLEILCDYYRLPAGSINCLNDEYVEILALQNLEQPGAMAGLSLRYAAAGSLALSVFQSNLPLSFDASDGGDEQAQGLRDPRLERLRSQGVETYLAAPFWVQGKPFGVVNCYGYEPRPEAFTTSGSAFLRYFCRWLGFVLEREKHLEKLQKLNENKDRLLAVVAHDLRNPISIVAGAAHMLDEAQLSGSEAQMLGFIHKACKHADSLIQELLEMAELEQHDLPLVATQRLWGELIEQVVSSYGPKAVAKSLRLSFVNDGPELRIALHPQKMTRVLENLLQNALKFTPAEGEIRLHLYRHGEEAWLTIQDTGIGIPEKLQAVLFNKFSLARRQGLEGEQSTGLGMSIVQEIIRQHGGRIQVFSSEGQGTCFRIEIPLLQAQGPLDDGAEPAQ